MLLKGPHVADCSENLSAHYEFCFFPSCLDSALQRLSKFRFGPRILNRLHTSRDRW